jgi:AraC-like DNA-binding protein
MIDLNNVQARDDYRINLAAQMAAFEERYGKVQTLPIRIGDAPVETFSINSPGKPKAEKPSRSLRAQDHQRVTQRTQRKMDNVRAIRELAGKGLKIADMAEQSGLTAKYVQKILNEHGIKRGPQTNMEG